MLSNFTLLCRHLLLAFYSMGPWDLGTLGALMVQASEYFFIKLIFPDNMVRFLEAQKVSANITHVVQLAKVCPCFLHN